MDDIRKPVVAAEEQTATKEAEVRDGEAEEEYSEIDEEAYEDEDFGDEDEDAMYDEDAEADEEDDATEDCEEPEETSADDSEEPEDETEPEEAQGDPETASEQPGKAETPTEQAAEENAKYAAARREAEAKYSEAENKLNAIYTKAGVSSFDELMAAFGDEKVQEKIKRAGVTEGKALDELVDREYLSAFRMQQQAESAYKVKTEAVGSRVLNDLDEFKRSYPSVEIRQLFGNEKFKTFIAGQSGVKSLKDAYDAYSQLVKQAATKGAQSYAAKAERSTSSSSGGNKTALTARQSKMLAEWNADNPGNPMTPEEFLKL